jgi:hypothetical protein
MENLQMDSAQKEEEIALEKKAHGNSKKAMMIK